MQISCADIEELCEVIGRAFGRLSMPSESELVYHGYGSGEHEVTDDLYELLGTRWQEVDDDLILEAAFELFRWLRPRAFRYYLAAYLTATLRRSATNENVLLSAAIHLSPCFRDVYLSGRDRRLQSRQNLFSKAQYAVICTFLGRIFEHEISARHQAARALYWGWNRADSAPLALVREYFHELRSDSGGHPYDPAAAAISREIELAFAETPYPGDNGIIYDSGISDPEVALVALEFRGVKWRQVHPALAEAVNMALPFFSDAAFRYYLPAFLRADLSECADVADPVWHLTRGFAETTPREIESVEIPEWGSRSGMVDLMRAHRETASQIKWRSYTAARCAGFTLRERKAIVAYLQHRARQGDYRNEIAAALEQYWLPSLGEW